MVVKTNKKNSWNEPRGRRMNLTQSVTELTEKPRVWWDGAPQGQRVGAMVGAAVLMLAVIIGLYSLGGGGDEWTADILYADLDYNEAAEVIKRLSELGVPYRLMEDASTIVVPRDRSRELRLQLAGEGFPRSGRMGYKIFDETQLAMTDFLQKVNLRRALQEEIEKTLLGIKGVKDVRVHLVIPEPSLFTEEENPVTSSVHLTLDSGTRLRDRQINAIVHLVASSVEGLHVDNVVIVDANGDMLSEDKDPLSKVANRQFEQKQQVERALEKKVQSLMDEVIGPKAARVRISVDLDFDQQNMKVTTYEPGETQIVLSEQTNEKDSAEQGTEAEAVRNYELNSTIKNIIGTVGTIERLSMALTIDKTKAVFDDESGKYIEEMRPQDEIDNLAELAKNAVGFVVERGDEATIFAMPFDKTQELKALQEQEAMETKAFWTNVAVNVAKVLGIIAALITLRFIIQAIGRGVGVEEELEVLGEMSSEIEDEDFDRPETPHDILLTRVQQMVRERPEDAAKLIRTMMLGDGSNAAAHAGGK
jgi:flagellar M-ring protein FliF